MRNVLLDTNAYSALRRGDADAALILQHAPLLILSSIVLGELLSGFATGKEEGTSYPNQ